MLEQDQKQIQKATGVAGAGELMLSRVAESIYWMCRYVERAENVARFIDVNLNLMLDAPSEDDQQWQPLVNISGDAETFTKHYPKGPTRDNVIQFLTFDRDNPNSILSCVRAARENARSVREIISSEMWLQLNTFYLMVNSATASGKGFESPNEFFSEVKLSSHLFTGITDATMTHGEAWHFCRISGPKAGTHRQNLAHSRREIFHPVALGEWTSARRWTTCNGWPYCVRPAPSRCFANAMGASRRVR